MLSRLGWVVTGFIVGGCEASSVDNPLTDPEDGPPAGNPDGECDVPDEARPEDTSDPDIVVGDGTPSSCTSQAFVQAVAQGGIITFDCGADPMVITLDETAKVFNDTGPEIIIDGGGLVTLSGAGARRGASSIRTHAMKDRCGPRRTATTRIIRA